MKIAIIYATIEGQTGKIARFLEVEATTRGHEVVRIDAEGSDPIDLDDVDRVILAAPVHQRRHPDHFEATLTAMAERLSKMPTLLLSVSLSAAFPEGREEAQDYLVELKMRTRFEPTAEALVAGAIRVGRYDYFAAQVVRLVVLRDRDVDTGQGDHEFTDWSALRRDLEAFLA